jgi:hypothetical protein
MFVAVLCGIRVIHAIVALVFVLTRHASDRVQMHQDEPNAKRTLQGIPAIAGELWRGLGLGYARVWRLFGLPASQPGRVSSSGRLDFLSLFLASLIWFVIWSGIADWVLLLLEPAGFVLGVF